MKFDRMTINALAQGSPLDRLLTANGDTNVLRPYSLDGKGTYVTLNGKAVLIGNTTASLRKEDWIALDKALVLIGRKRLNAVGDLNGRGLVYNIPDGMGSTVLQTETQGDAMTAQLSMDGLRRSPNDRPLYELTNLPLPIMHADFSYSARNILASRKSGTPLDTSTMELAVRQVSQKTEQLLLGLESTYTYGGGSIYGYTNYPSRLTKTITAPTVSGWAGGTLLAELLAARKQLVDVKMYGPYMLYFAPAWDQYLDADYVAGYPKTTRARIGEVAGFEGLKTLDYLEDNDIIMIQMTSDVIRMVNAMPMRTLQWDESGGLQKNFKVMTIQIPQLRKDQDDNCGLLHASSA